MMDTYGGYERPQLENVLWVWLMRSPIKLYAWLIFQADWIWRFGIKREQYGDREKEYVVRKNLKLTERQWSALSDQGKGSYMKRELWKADNWEEYRLEQEEKERIKQAESGRSKQERRWLKNSDNRMTFDENYDW